MEKVTDEGSGRMLSAKRVVVGFGVVAVVLFVLFLLGGFDENEETAEGIKYKEVTVERGTFQVTVSASGIVRPIDRIELKSKASGEIVELPVEEGDVVKKGTLIARLDQKDERAQLAQAEADIDVARAELKQAERTFERREKLFENNLISEEERDQMQLALATARGKVIQATTTLDRATERLAEAIVRAPIEGVILQKYVEQGQIISSGVSNVSGGTPIVDIADMSSVHIEAGVDEVDIGKVRVGQDAVVVADAFPELSFTGEIVRIAPEARLEQNVTLFDVVVQVQNANRMLKSAMNTTIEIMIDRQDDVLLLPAVALQEEDAEGKKRRGEGNTRVVLLKQGEEFVRHEVEIGGSSFRSAIVISGLKDGDVLGIPMVSRLKEDNQQLEDRIRSSRSFGTGSRSTTPR